MHTYGEQPSDFQVGQRVELHPATDWWMRGARFGTVARIGRKYVMVKLDRAGRVNIMAHNLRAVDHGVPEGFFSGGAE